MTKPPDEILAALNVRINELMGVSFEGMTPPFRYGYRIASGGIPTAVDVIAYTGSLDAITPAVRALTSERRTDFIFNLSIVQGGDVWDVATADAPTLCIALDRTLSPSPIL